MLERSLDVSPQLLDPQVAEGYAEVIPLHDFQLVRFIKNYRCRLGQGTCIGRALRSLLDGEISEK